MQLSREERALYNPAFTGTLCIRAVQGYDKEHAAACPLPVAVTASVMALQPAIRAALPATTGTGLMGWLEANEHVRVEMSRNAALLADVVRPGLLFALQSRVLHCTAAGLIPVPRALAKTPSGDTPQTVDIQRAALMLGRWLPSTGSLGTVLTLLGVKP
ncbi:three component ABC system middle component [Streptomyces sp. NPDC091368]|uniref:three component ABC system middle component n=1 Tax=Streptomyces sp. NPDC091368 TaxID=3365993 RepID=UPI0037F15B70